MVLHPPGIRTFLINVTGFPSAAGLYQTLTLKCCLRLSPALRFQSSRAPCHHTSIFIWVKATVCIPRPEWASVIPWQLVQWGCVYIGWQQMVPGTYPCQRLFRVGLNLSLVPCHILQWPSWIGMNSLGSEKKVKGCNGANFD